MARKKDEITEDDLRRLGLEYDPRDPTRMIPVSRIPILPVSGETLSPPELPTHTPEELEALTRLIGALGPLSAEVIARLPDGHDFVVQGRAVREAARRAGREKDLVVITAYGLSESGARWLRVLMEFAGRDRSKLRELRQAVVEAFPTLSPRELERLIPSVDHCTWWREQRKARGVSTETPALLTTSFSRAPQAGKVLDDLTKTAKSLPPGTHSRREVRTEAWKTDWRQKNCGPAPDVDDRIEIHHCPYDRLEAAVGDLTARADVCWLDPHWGAKPDEMRRIAEYAGRVTRRGGVLVGYVGDLSDWEWEAAYRSAGFQRVGSVTLVNGIAVDEQGRLRLREDGSVGFRGDPRHNSRWRYCRREALIMIRGGEADATGWKPLRIIETLFCAQEAKSKRHTEDWAQPLGEAVYLLERLAPPGSLVVDPMCGSGTSAIACELLGGRRFIGCDLSQEEVFYARRWLQEVRNSDSIRTRGAVPGAPPTGPSPTPCAVPRGRSYAIRRGSSRVEGQEQFDQQVDDRQSLEFDQKEDDPQEDRIAARLRDQGQP